MYHKNFERNLVYLLETLLLMCVSARPTKNRDVKEILYDNELNEMSSNICSGLRFDIKIYRCFESFLLCKACWTKWVPLPNLYPPPNSSARTAVFRLDGKNLIYEECIKKFYGPTTTSSAITSPVKFWCRTEDSITVQVPPSKNWQLVILVPEPSVGDRDINIAIFKPSIEFETINILSWKNYTLWSAELVDGTPLFWQGGDMIPPFISSAVPEHKNYDIEVKSYFTNVTGKLELKATVLWNTTDESDACFDVVNTCNHVQYPEIPLILPDQKRRVELSNLPWNDRCSVQVRGALGVTKLEYNTTSCTDLKVCLSDDIKMLLPAEVSKSATEAEDGTWEVRLNWTRPAIQPERYRITLIADYNKTREIPGDVTETVITGVVGNWLYLVTVDCIIGETTSRKVERGFFPTKSHAGPGAGEVGGVFAAAWSAGAAALGALSAALAWRHRCAGQREKPAICYPEVVKPPIDDEIESAVIELETTDDCWEVRSDTLLLHEVIGEGAFGVVRKGTLAPGGREVAVKMLKDFPTLEELRSFRSEMELMKSVGVHPHIVSLVGCCSGRKPLIISEFCSRGDLLSYLRCAWDLIVSKQNAKYYNNNSDTAAYRNDLFNLKTQTENSKLVVNKLYELQGICEKELTALDLLSFCRQIAMGMEYLAANRVVHRDLAARNILVTSDKTLKIADFGLSRDVYEENQYKQTGNGKLPVKWMALESLTRRIYTSQSDVWSFGVVVWEVVTMGGSPYPEVPAARLPRLLRSGYRMPRPINCSKQLYEVMVSCWRAAPRARPTFGELHARMDQLLHAASTNPYLALQLDADDAPAHAHVHAHARHKYFTRLIRDKLNWSRSENYERPVRASQSNHYTSPPAGAARTQPV